MADQDKDKKSNDRALASTRSKHALVAETVRAFAPEVLRSLEDSGSININVVLADLTQKSESAQEVVGLARELLEIAATYNDHDVQAFRQRMAAITQAKLEDPDEIDKRKNSQVRRGLSWIVGALAPIGLVGTIACGMMGCSVTVTGSLLVITIVALGVAGSLASGEPVNSKDIAQILKATSEVVRSNRDAPSNSGSRHGRKNKTR